MLKSLFHSVSEHFVHSWYERFVQSVYEHFTHFVYEHYDQVVQELQVQTMYKQNAHKVIIDVCSYERKLKRHFLSTG